MLTEDAPYQPSAELARLHLWAAVNHLLSKAPLQGKAALDRVVSDIRDQYFPNDPSQAEQWLRRSPIGRARPALVRNFVIVALKSILDIATPLLERQNMVTSLAAVQRIHPQYVDMTMYERCDNIISEARHPRLVIGLIRRIPTVWSYLSEDTRDRCKRMVASPPPDYESGILKDALAVDALRNSALDEIQKLDPDRFLNAVQDLDWGVRFRATIDRLVKSEAFSTTTELLSAIRDADRKISKDELCILLRTAMKNDQVWNSGSFAYYLRPIFRDHREYSTECRDEANSYASKILGAPHSVEACAILAQDIRDLLD